MRLVAGSQLTGSYGTVQAGEEFECHDATAQELLLAGLAKRAGPPAVRYETKVIVPSQAAFGGGAASESFRDVPLPDAGPETVVAEGDYVFPDPNAPKFGAADSVRRAGRPRSATR